MRYFYRLYTLCYWIFIDHSKVYCYDFVHYYYYVEQYNDM